MRRRYVLTALAVAVAALTALVIFEVLATVLFALTAAYVALPLHRRLLEAPAPSILADRGVVPVVAAGITTGVVFLVGLVVASPLAFVTYLRRDDLVALFEELPESVTIDLVGFTWTVEAIQVWEFVLGWLQETIPAVLAAAPELALKLGLFGIVVYGALLGSEATARAVYAPVPSHYHDVVAAFDERLGSALWTIYVVQAVTALGTFLIALPVFYLLGYAFPVTLAAVASVLQFLPIVGPSLLIVGLAVFHLANGQLVAAVGVLVVGGLFVAMVPDLVLRPQLATHAGGFPGTLYFVGFVGGLLTVGPIGIIAGPLAVALFVESVALLSGELRGPALSE